MIITLGLVFAGSAIISFKRAIGAVMFEVSISKYLFRIGIDPPVEEIEMVGGFMDPEGASGIF
jgi:hypothetical protein